jgi:hypothetical protein
MVQIFGSQMALRLSVSHTGSALLLKNIILLLLVLIYVSLKIPQGLVHREELGKLKNNRLIEAKNPWSSGL